MGDGNCLFRALSDQLYGNDSQHLDLRKDICDWITSRQERYAPFVDDERGVEEHLRSMRRPGTWGGHLELSAFAHCKRRNVKVIQPGLVYVIEWNTGIDAAPATAPLSQSSVSSASSSVADDAAANDREKRRLRREKLKDEHERVDHPGAVYVAYHDWEHFSSVRNEAGPHDGPPCVVETPPPPDASMDDGAVSKHKLKQALKHPKRPPKLASGSKHPSELLRPPSPSLIPLPPSPEPSRGSSPATTQLSTSTNTSGSTAPSSIAHLSAPSARRITLRLRPPSRAGCSPKRSFDESERDDLTPEPESIARKKQRRRMSGAEDMDVEIEADIDADGNSSDSSALSSLSSAGSVSSTAVRASTREPPTPTAQARPLTRRQLKKLGLPKPRAVAAGGTQSATKITIPGGRFRPGPTRGVKAKSVASPPAADSDAGEWKTNGTGRLDVRGFRELRI